MLKGNLVKKRYTTTGIYIHQKKVINLNPKWAIELGAKIDKFTDECVRFATVASAIDSMGNKPINKAYKRIGYYHGTLFSPVLFGVDESTYDLKKGNDYAHRAYTLKKKAITNELIVLGQEANDNGLWSEFDKVLTSILQRLKGLDQDTILFALERFIEIFRKELLSIQNERTEHETVAKFIKKILDNSEVR